MEMELIKIWIKSSEQGNPDAQYNHDNVYYNGDGIDKDIGKAIYWFEKSAEQGDHDAKIELEKLLRIKNDHPCKIN